MLSKKIKEIIAISGLALLIFIPMKANSFGLSFSYFYPRGGYFSYPLVPVTLKDMGFRAKYFGVSSSLALYSINGMQIKGLPFEVEEPVMGPFNSLVGTVTPKLMLPVGSFEFTVQAGGFAFYNFNSKVIYGNLDRAIAQNQNLDAVNSEFDFENNPGYGYTFGGSITYYVISEVVGVTVGASYFRGSSELNLRGHYKGGNSTGDFVEKTVEYPESRLDFRGVEFSVGVTILSGSEDPENK